jgi:uncharacterized protein
MQADQFSVSRVRSAAACPRIIHFDAAEARERALPQVSVTRVWKAGRNEGTACGALFHSAIERFNRQVATDPAVFELLSATEDSAALAQALLSLVYRQHVDRETLFGRPAERQQAFMDALRRYLRELAGIVVHARAVGIPPHDTLDELFGDRRRRVDTTFSVGPAGEPVQLTGLLDHAFYDRRSGRDRIVDYRLTSAEDPANDLFQVCVFALIHHVQYGTEPGAVVLYLHPFRQLVEKSWDEVHAGRHAVYNLLASLRDWVAYDEATVHGLKPPGDPSHCEVCRWNKLCEKQLGPKHEGRRVTDWSGYYASEAPPLIRQI